MIINHERYPLAEPVSSELREVVSRARQELRTLGCSVLPDFVHPAARDTLRSECALMAPLAHFQVDTVNVYNTDPEESLPEDHPGRITMERGNAFVARDRIPAHSIIHQLYHDGHFQQFIAECFELPRLYAMADTLAGLCLNVVRPGMEHPWHFDTCEFTVSMLIQRAEGGGVFEYCPNIRSARDESFVNVREVLLDRGGHLIRPIELRPGDLQLFKGRYSLHRVSRVLGETARHSAIFAYCKQPGVIGTPTRTRQLFGRVGDEHLAQGKLVRADKLLD